MAGMGHIRHPCVVILGSYFLLDMPKDEHLFAGAVIGTTFLLLLIVCIKGEPLSGNE